MDHDIVIASRDKIIGWGAQRHLASKVATLLAQALFFRGRIDDPMSGFFGAKKSILQKYGDKVSPRGYKALFTIMKHYVHDCGYDRVTSVDYTFINRRCGDSKLSMNEIVDYLRSLINVKVPAPSLKLPRLVFEPSYAMHERVQPSGYCSFVMRVL
jgi:hypothetical protein